MLPESLPVVPNSTNQTVSVVVPCYNAREFVLQCLGSVFAHQSTPVEAILVDDGSADGSADAVASAFGAAVQSVERNEEEHMLFSIKNRRILGRAGMLGNLHRVCRQYVVTRSVLRRGVGAALRRQFRFLCAVAHAIRSSSVPVRPAAAGAVVGASIDAV